MNFKPWKKRVTEARQRLGPEMSDSILAAWRKIHGHRGTLKEIAGVLESAIPEVAKPRGAGAAPVARRSPADTDELLRPYDALRSDEARREFWQKNARLLSDRLPGLVLVCMASGKPLSTRARLQLPATVKEIQLTKKEFLALSPYERGQFQERGGKIVRETLARSLFEKLPAQDQAEFCRNGGTLID